MKAVSAQHPTRGDARAALVREAQEALRTNSFDAQALAALAKRAGVSQPLLHYHFRSREDLWRAAVTDAFAPLEAAFEHASAELKGLAAAGRLELLMRRFVLFSAQHPVVAAVIVTETMRVGPRLQWLLDHHLAPLHRTVDAILAMGVAEGGLRPLPEVHVTQAFVFAAAGFFACAPLVERLYGVDPASLVDAHADALVTLFLSGLRADSKPARERARRLR
jgi:TetR/AcrR family transcriptional regulator